MSEIEVDILIEEARWSEIGLESLVHQALAACFARFDLMPGSTEVSVLACDDARISALNGDFREKPTATNVLSWPSQNLSAEMAGETPQSAQPGPDGVLALGDIAIAFETCAREAAEMGITLEAHATHLIVHGTLHLLGYDHLRDPDATLMQGIETEILGKMGLNDPYRI